MGGTMRCSRSGGRAVPGAHPASATAVAARHSRPPLRALACGEKAADSRQGRRHRSSTASAGPTTALRPACVPRNHSARPPACLRGRRVACEGADHLINAFGPACPSQLLHHLFHLQSCKLALFIQLQGQGAAAEAAWRNCLGLAALALKTVFIIGCRNPSDQATGLCSSVEQQPSKQKPRLGASADPKSAPGQLYASPHTAAKLAGCSFCLPLSLRSGSAARSAVQNNCPADLCNKTARHSCSFGILDVPYGAPCAVLQCWRVPRPLLPRFAGHTIRAAVTSIQESSCHIG